MYPHFDPTQTPEERARERERLRRERHSRWLSMLSGRDWRRLGEIADRLAEGRPSARLDDLDARGIAAGVFEPDMAERLNGERVGTLRGFVVVVWPKG